MSKRTGPVAGHSDPVAHILVRLFDSNDEYRQNRKHTNGSCRTDEQAAAAAAEVAGEAEHGY